MTNGRSRERSLESSWSRLEDSLVGFFRGLEQLGRRLEARGGWFMKVIVIDLDRRR
jgi:hypothetical protein